MVYFWLIVYWPRAPNRSWTVFLFNFVSSFFGCRCYFLSVTVIFCIQSGHFHVILNLYLTFHQLFSVFKILLLLWIVVNASILHLIKWSDSNQNSTKWSSKIQQQQILHMKKKGNQFATQKRLKLKVRQSNYIMILCTLCFSMNLSFVVVVVFV